VWQPVRLRTVRQTAHPTLDRPKWTPFPASLDGSLKDVEAAGNTSKGPREGAEQAATT